jgi:glutamate dehydrogenase
LIITKSIYRSPVHRADHLDYLGVKRFDQDGNVIGEYRFLGLFNHIVYTSDVTDIPLLRLKVNKLKDSLRVKPRGHRGRSLEHILAQYPRDEMLQSSQDDLETIVQGVLEAYDCPQLKLFTRTDVYCRFITVLILLPKEQFNDKVRKLIEQILVEGLGGSDAEFQAHWTQGLLAMLQFNIHAQDAHQLEIDSDMLEEKIAESLLSWEDSLLEQLIDINGEERGKVLYGRYNDVLPGSYKADVGAVIAAQDISKLETLGNQSPIATSLYFDSEKNDQPALFKLYGKGTGKALSDVLPILDNMGVKVINGRSYLLDSSVNDKAWILEFDISFIQGNPPQQALVKELFEESFFRVYTGVVDNDGYNQLVVAAKLNWRDVIVLRAIGRYLSQLQIPFSQLYLEATLANNPAITASLVELFHQRFNPTLSDNHQVAIDISASILHELDEVRSLDEDRILRGFHAVILAILRTNHYMLDADGANKKYLSFKLDPERIPGMPLPCPKYEIFVFSSEVEGVHLRGGKVARGGLRWSDRREDYRTEVLGLVKAQMVKNAVIVPAGSKGGFVCKKLPVNGSRDDIQIEGVSCYKTFISGLLDLTDNLVNDNIVPPNSVVRYDDDDPYLVVAADKGTATFSDIANSIANQYGFWLGDAFASGGKNGYDHKKMGITAKGAWESVRRLFMEQSVDTQSEEFTVVGIGDMSGDVFGNGMLLSRYSRLVAAFNHQHIFIDPYPNNEKAYFERQRMFNLPSSSWPDYDEQLISQGGGIFSRTAKRIQITKEMHQVLGIDEKFKHLSPNDLIRSLLKAPVDLLWNGGIGTYVKFSGESNDEVADRANDNVRINANELRCGVVGEGGNLGFTQQGRIEYARNGGLINTDAIDNSGGVDCSDHEVNIKILLNQAQSAGELKDSERNKLLASMSDEVASLVIRQNYQQSAQLSFSESTAFTRLNEDKHLIQKLVREGRLNPELEFMPQEEVLTERFQKSEGLCRPEMSVLLAYSKNKLYEELVQSELARDSYLQMQLREYFPKSLQKRYKSIIDEHPLRHEIVAIQLTNHITNRMGATFCHAMLEQSQATYADIVRAFIVAQELLSTHSLVSAIEDLDNLVPYKSQLLMHQIVNHSLEQVTLWLLTRCKSHIDINLLIERFRPGMKSIIDDIDTFLTGDTLNSHKERIQLLIDDGVSDGLANKVSHLVWSCNALDMIWLSESTSEDLSTVMKGYLGLDMNLGIHMLRLNILSLPEDDLWNKKVRASLIKELDSSFRRVVANFIEFTKDRDDISEALSDWKKQSTDTIDSYRNTLVNIRALGSPNLAMLSVAVSELKMVS